MKLLRWIYFVRLCWIFRVTGIQLFIGNLRRRKPKPVLVTDPVQWDRASIERIT